MSECHLIRPHSNVIDVLRNDDEDDYHDSGASDCCDYDDIHDDDDDDDDDNDDDDEHDGDDDDGRRSPILILIQSHLYWAYMGPGTEVQVQVQAQVPQISYWSLLLTWMVKDRWCSKGHWTDVSWR